MLFYVTEYYKGILVTQILNATHPKWENDKEWGRVVGRDRMWCRTGIYQSRKII